MPRLTMLRQTFGAHAPRCLAQSGATQSTLYNYECCFSTAHDVSRKGDADVQSDAEHEAEGAKSAGGFVKQTIAAVAHTAKEKLASAVGMSNEKPISDSEGMGPAGFMQNKDPNSKAEDEYAELKRQSSNQWEGAQQDKPPNHQYPDHGKNA